MENEQEFVMKNWDSSINRAKSLEIMNAFNKYIDPESYIEEKEDALDYYFGKNENLPNDFLYFENIDGKIVGITGLFNLNGFAKTWRVFYTLYPEYLDTSLPQMIIDAGILLAKNSDKPEIHLKTIGLENQLDKALNHHGKSPFHYMWSMQLVNFNPPERIKTLGGITVQFSEEIKDIEAYISVLNPVFQNHFEFNPMTAEKFEQMEKINAPYFTSNHYFAFDQNKMVGFCHMEIEKEQGKTGTIGGLGVHPDYQNRGIGSVLLTKGVEFLQSTEVSKIKIGVDGENNKALELYKKFGFRVEDNLTWKFYHMK